MRRYRQRLPIFIHNRNVTNGAAPTDPTEPTEYFEKRYARAYSVAHTLTASGSVLEEAGKIIGGIVAVGPVFLLFNFGVNAVTVSIAVAGLVIGITIYLLGFAAGTILKTLGQILLATLDTAVNTCPHLSDAQKCGIMGMRSPGQNVGRKQGDSNAPEPVTGAVEPEPPPISDAKVIAAQNAIDEMRARVDTLLADGKFSEAAAVRARADRAEARVARYLESQANG